MKQGFVRSVSDEDNLVVTLMMIPFVPVGIGRYEWVGVRQIPTEIGSGQAHVDVGKKGKPRAASARESCWVHSLRATPQSVGVGIMVLSCTLRTVPVL